MAPGDAPKASEWETLDAISSDVRSCTRCTLSETRTLAVPGEGSEYPSIMFIGEGPGFNEDQQGRPFVGRAGALLEELLALVPLRREDVYITNVVKCRPPENRDPLPHEVKACWPFLEAQIKLLKPKVIATLGRHSLMRLFPDARISDRHGTIMKWRDGIVVFPLYHPAAGLRSGRLKLALQKDFVKLPQAIIAALAVSREDPPTSSNTSSVGDNRNETAGEDGDHGGDDPQMTLF